MSHTDIAVARRGRSALGWHWPVVILAAAYVLLFADRGFDMTDEAYYVAWIVDPARFTASVHPFGLPLSLLFKALGRSLIALRAAGVLMLLGSGAVLGRFLGDYYRGTLRDEQCRALVPLGALYGLSYFAIWILTPSYNLLANVGACLIFAGALGWDSNDRDGLHRRDWLASCLVGLGGCVCFYGKPTTAAIAAGAIVILLARTWRRHGAARALARAAIVAFSCVVPLALIMIGSVGIVPFIDSIKLGTSFGNGPGDLPRRTVSNIYRSSPILWVNVTLFAAALAWHKGEPGSGSPTAMRRLVAAVLVVDLVFVVWTVGYGSWMRGRPWVLIGICTLCLILAELSWGLIDTRRRVDVHTMGPVIALLVLPFAIAFGTLNGLMLQTGMSLFAMLLAFTVGGWLVCRPAWASWIEMGAAAYTLVVLVWSSAIPYGLPRSMFRQTDSVTLPFTPDTLHVDRETRDFIVGLQRLAARENLGAMTPILDLSGGGPGAALILNDRAPVFPWLSPMPSTIALVNNAWDSLAPRQQDDAWIIGEITPIYLATKPATALTTKTRGYRLVARIPATLWDRPRLVQVWKPTRPAMGRSPAP